MKQEAHVHLNQLKVLEGKAKISVNDFLPRTIAAGKETDPSFSVSFKLLALIFNGGKGKTYNVSPNIRRAVARALGVNVEDIFWYERKNERGKRNDLTNA